MNVKFTKDEYSCLIEKGFLPEHLFASVREARKIGDFFSLELSDGIADEVRDICGEHLQETGFDEDYNLNDKGKVLESLVDKLFIG